jgi:hypothetical protein
MRKKVLTATIVALVSGVLLGLLGMLSACGVATEASIESITVSRQVSNEIPITNYRVNYKQTPEEWQALSTDDKAKLAKLGFEKVLEQVEADGTSNFNATGMTASGTDAEGNLMAPQSTMFLSREQGILLVYSGVDPENPNLPVAVTEIPVELP